MSNSLIFGAKEIENISSDNGLIADIEALKRKFSLGNPAGTVSTAKSCGRSRQRMRG